MSGVNAVKNSEPRANCLHYMVTGGALGYAAKHLIPVTEHDKRAFGVDEFAKAQKPLMALEKQDFIDKVQKLSEEKPGNKAYATFLEMIAQKKHRVKDYFTAEEFKQLPKSERVALRQLCSEYAEHSRGLIDGVKNLYINTIKGNRSNMVFIGLGIIGGAVTACAWNALRDNGQRLRREAAKMDLDCTI